MKRWQFAIAKVVAVLFVISLFVLMMAGPVIRVEMRDARRKQQAELEKHQLWQRFLKEHEPNEQDFWDIINPEYEDQRFVYMQIPEDLRVLAAKEIVPMTTDRERLRCIINTFHPDEVQLRSIASGRLLELGDNNDINDLRFVICKVPSMTDQATMRLWHIAGTDPNLFDYDLCLDIIRNTDALSAGTRHWAWDMLFNHHEDKINEQIMYAMNSNDDYPQEAVEKLLLLELPENMLRWIMEHLQEIADLAWEKYESINPPNSDVREILVWKWDYPHEIVMKASYYLLENNPCLEDYKVIYDDCPMLKDQLPHGWMNEYQAAEIAKEKAKLSTKEGLLRELSMIFDQQHCN